MRKKEKAKKKKLKEMMIALVFVAILMFAGCTTQESQIVSITKPIKPTDDQKALETSNQPQTKDTFSSVIAYDYKPGGRRDPFKSLIVKKEEVGKKGQSPLEQDDISTFRLVAIVWTGKEYFASITLPDGKSYTVRKGMRLGLDGGIVHEITKDTVVVKQDQAHKRDLRSKEVILRLRSGE
ncbi:MAG: pilus assembly protein PilP [Thermodesulfovibrionales bacterium]|nr:pilus assembly protein PilP [Thermodesulfovibrionales bacterium]